MMFRGVMFCVAAAIGFVATWSPIPTTVQGSGGCNTSSLTCVDDCCRATCAGVTGASAHVRCMNEAQPECRSCCHPGEAVEPEGSPTSGTNKSFECSGHVPCSQGEHQDGCQHYRHPVTARNPEEAESKLVLACKYEKERQYGGTWDCTSALLCIDAEPSRQSAGGDTEASEDCDTSQVTCSER